MNALNTVMDNTNFQIFEMSKNSLHFDITKSILLCKSLSKNKNRWVKKIGNINLINHIIEDNNRYYISCETDDTSGEFLAINKKNGSTLWYIPGRSYFQQMYDGYLYIIFINETNKYFLIKVDISDGSKIWDREVKPDLDEYSFRNDRILLKYGSGKIEKISPHTGSEIKT